MPDDGKNIIDLLDKRIEAMSFDSFQNALISMGVAAFLALYANKRNRKALMAEAIRMYAGFEGKEEENCFGELLNVVEQMAR